MGAIKGGMVVATPLEIKNGKAINLLSVYAKP
jgi:hypothetical protein